MGLVEIIIIVIGLMVFEVVSSVDNAVINAQVLSTTTAAARRWFLTWGLLFSVVLVRGLLPLLIVFAVNPTLGITGAFVAAFSSDPSVTEAIEASQPILLAGGGLYLVLLFLHWMLVEPKQYAFAFEQRLHTLGNRWFYVVALSLTAAIAAAAASIQLAIGLSAVVGASVFFISASLKSGAEHAEAQLLQASGSPWRKIVYLELIDTAFSIDGVLGAFAFTTAVPLILLGNGLGVLVIRHLTMHGIARISRYRYLVNGAMYSIACLGTVMLVDSFHLELPFWLSPLVTVSVVSYFFWRSRTVAAS